MVPNAAGKAHSITSLLISWEGLQEQHGGIKRCSLGRIGSSVPQSPSLSWLSWQEDRCCLHITPGWLSTLSPCPFVPDLYFQESPISQQSPLLSPPPFPLNPPSPPAFLLGLPSGPRLFQEHKYFCCRGPDVISGQDSPFPCCWEAEPQNSMDNPAQQINH